MTIRFETLTRGQGDVGRKAAQDAAYIQGKFNDLVRIWPLSTPGKVIVTDGSEY